MYFSNEDQGMGIGIYPEILKVEDFQRTDQECNILQAEKGSEEQRDCRSCHRKQFKRLRYTLRLRLNWNPK